MISLYIDEHVARAITEGLRLRGIDVLTVQEDGRRGISDAAVLDRATELGRPLFTQDEDLLIETSRRIAQGAELTSPVCSMPTSSVRRSAPAFATSSSSRPPRGRKS